MSWKDGRPDDWSVIRDIERQGHCSIEFNGGFECGASAMLSARDKWWIEWGESQCPHVPNETYCKRWCIHCWQSLKQSLEKKDFT